MLPFEWDERKRAANLVKHGVDFELAKLIFEGPTLEGPDDCRDYGEPRLAPSGWPGVSCCSWSTRGADGDAADQRTKGAKGRKA